MLGAHVVIVLIIATAGLFFNIPHPENYMDRGNDHAPMFMSERNGIVRHEAQRAALQEAALRLYGWIRPYRITLRRCTVRSPFTVMFTMYTPVAMSPGRSSTVVKRSPLLLYPFLNTCLP